MMEFTGLLHGDKKISRQPTTSNLIISIKIRFILIIRYS